MFNHLESELFGIDGTTFSREGFLELYDRAPDLAQRANSGKKFLPLYQNMQCDTYNWFYKGAPRIKSSAEVSGLIEPHVHLLKHMEGLESLQRLRRMTTRNELASLVATRRLEEVVENLPAGLREAIKGHYNAMMEAKQMRKRLDGLRDMYKTLRKQTANVTGKKLEELQAKMKELQQKIKSTKAQTLQAVQSAAQNAQKMRQEFANNEQTVQGQMSEAIRSAIDDIEATMEAIDAFGCGEGEGAGRKMPVKDQLEVARMLKDDEQLKRIARLAGRIQRIHDHVKRNKTTRGSETIVDVVLGGKLERLTGSEFVNLAHPVMKKELWARLLDGKALNWQKESREPEGLGPVVCCVDGSGSMGGNEIIWAKAVALVQYREAAKRKQPFYYIQFCDGAQDNIAWSYDDYQKRVGRYHGFSAVVQRFDAAPGEELLLMRFTQIFLGGGTDFDLAFTMCLWGMNQDDFKKADVLFISDMCFPIAASKLSKKFRERMEKSDASCWAVYTGSGEMQKDQMDLFKHFATACWQIDPYRPDDDVQCLTELFANMDEGK